LSDATVHPATLHSSANFTDALLDEVIFDEQTNWPSKTYAPPGSARKVVDDDLTALTPGSS